MSPIVCLAVNTDDPLHHALAAFERALLIDPANKFARSGRANVLFRLGHLDEAERAFLHLLQDEPDDAGANIAMFEIAHYRGDLERALFHQARAIAKQRVFSRIARNQRRRVLALFGAGDWQANTPLDFLIDERTTTLHKLYLLPGDAPGDLQLPEFDVVFNAIGESEAATATLHTASDFLRERNVRCINRPEAVLNTNRVRIVEKLAGLDSCHAPAVVRIERDALDARTVPVAFPIVIRPIGSHGGRAFERCEDPAALGAYRDATPADAYFVSPFIDYRNDDGYFRKYRIIIVDGEVFPYHLAISPNWMVHYYNAPMTEQAWMREEEERFLADCPTVFGQLMDTLRAIARRLELDYVGVDCSIDRDGRLLLFEADPAMIVHLRDPEELFPYKHRYVPRIFSAVERLLDAHRA